MTIDTTKECFDECRAISFCAAASFTRSWKDNCLLFKYGCELFNSTRSTAFIKTEFLSDAKIVLQDIFSNDKVISNYKSINEFASFDSLTPTTCFRNCSQNPNCTSASFRMISDNQANCFLYNSTRFYDYVFTSTVSYVKKDPSATKIYTDVLSNVSLTSSRTYKSCVASSRGNCFERCDLDSACAGATYKESLEINCILHQYGFEKVQDPNSVTCIQEDALRDIENEADPEHPADVINFQNAIFLREIAFTDYFDLTTSRTPSDCFKLCQKMSNCSAASFYPSQYSETNCYFHSNTIAQGSTSNTFLSFVKHNPKDYEQAPIRNSSLVKFNNCLHTSFQRRFAHSFKECVETCDSLEVCAAANFLESLSEIDCFLYEYGFTESRCDSWISYTKQAIMDEPDIKKLPEGLLNGRIEFKKNINYPYEYSTKLSPFRCFKECNENSKCKAAVFTSTWNNADNCRLKIEYDDSTPADVSSYEDDNYILFIKN